jgi:RND family efflux transporter MFP subunit
MRTLISTSAILADALKSLRPWQIVVLVIVLLGAAGGTYGGYARASGPERPVLGTNQQLIPVKYGNLVNQVSTSGNLAFPNREKLTFGSKGIVEALLVVEGHRVVKGQVIARIDRTALASLEQAVAQARVDLKNVQDALDEAKKPPALALAQSRTNGAAAEVSLKEALKVLDDIAPQHARDLVQARQAKADAELALDKARKALGDFAPQYGRDLVNARQAKAQAELTLEEAVKTLDRFAPDHGRQLAQVRQARADADLAMKEAQGSLVQFTLDYQAKLATGRKADSDALVALKQAEEARDRFEAANGRRLDPVRQETARMEAELERVRADLSQFRALESAGAKGLDLIIHRRRESEEFIQAWLLDAHQFLGESKQMEGAVAVALATLDKVRHDLVELEKGPDLVKQRQLEVAVELARAKLAEAQRNLAVLEPGASSTQGQQLLAAVEVAKGNLKKAQGDLAEVERGPDGLRRQQLAAAVETAQANLKRDQELLAELEAGPDPVKRTLKERQVDLARETLVDAKKVLDVLLKEPDPLKVALKEGQVALARVTLADAEQRVERGALRSPVTGFVSLVSVKQGDEVTASATIVEIVDPSVVEVAGTVAEIDVLLVREGTRATVVLDALRGQMLEGTVSEIAPVAVNQQGVVNYPIRVRLRAPEGLQLREGLSTVANIILREERNVLLVPQQALYGSFDQPMVKVMNIRGVVEERPVVLGNSDDVLVVVRQGLKEGDKVVMEKGRVTTRPLNLRQFSGSGGGGLPGVGGSGGGPGGGRR